MMARRGRGVVGIRQQRLEKAVADLVSEFPELLVCAPAMLDDRRQLPEGVKPYLYATAGHPALLVAMAEWVAGDIEARYSDEVEDAEDEGE